MFCYNTVNSNNLGFVSFESYWMSFKVNHFCISAPLVAEVGGQVSLMTTLRPCHFSKFLSCVIKQWSRAMLILFIFHITL